MDISISAAITKINEMMNGLIAALPNVVIGIIIFIAFLFGSVDLLTDRRMSFPHAFSGNPADGAMDAR
ncbi:MAG: hypothetical protein KDJ52_23895 [Anaerolineae bacterium]|nr:hypothetical protein [Anaerolineae bacterium]